MIENPTRRQALFITSAAIAASATGCGTSNVTQPVAATASDAAEQIEDRISASSDEDLKRYKLALRGYQIVSLYIAGRTVFLPYPGMRVVSVMIVATSVAAKLAVEYIDDELILRKIQESLDSQDRASIESDGYVTFETDSGLTEEIYLAPTAYTDGA